MHIELLNGKTTTLPLNHRALSFGDGVFETCYVSQGKIEFFEEHLERLQSGAKNLNLKFQTAEKEALFNQLEKQVANADTPHVLKIMLLRNSFGRGYDFDPAEQELDTVVQIMPYQLPEWIGSGASVLASDDLIFEHGSLKGIKHLNRLDSVMARQSARSSGKHEALMRDQNGRYIEGSMSNLFVHLSGKWITPKLTGSGVNGIIRGVILKRYPSIEEHDIGLTDLQSCESAFICNSLIGVVEVTDINDRMLKKDQFTQSLMKELFSRD